MSVTRAQCYNTFYDRNLIIFRLSQSVCYNRLKKLVMDKPSSLLLKFVYYVRKKFYNIGPTSRLGTLRRLSMFRSLTRLGAQPGQEPSQANSQAESLARPKAQPGRKPSQAKSLARPRAQPGQAPSQAESLARQNAQPGYKPVRLKAQPGQSP